MNKVSLVYNELTSNEIFTILTTQYRFQSKAFTVPAIYNTCTRRDQNQTIDSFTDSTVLVKRDILYLSLTHTHKHTHSNTNDPKKKNDNGHQL